MPNQPSLFQPEPTAVLRYRSLTDVGGALMPLFNNHRTLPFVVIFSPTDAVWYLMSTAVWMRLNRPHPTDGIQPAWSGSLSALLDLVHNIPLSLQLDRPDAPDA